MTAAIRKVLPKTRSAIQPNGRACIQSLMSVLPELRLSSTPNGLSEKSVRWTTEELRDCDPLLAQNRPVGVHYGNAPVAGLDALAAVRAIACGRICLDG